MFSTRTRWGAVALACTLGIASAASAGTIVISASGPSARSYPAGKSLGAGSRIVLAAGDTLTVLDSRGTRTLRGPITTSAEAAAVTTSKSFADLIQTQNRRRARTGAIRGSGVEPKPANMWQVDLTRGGTFCVADPSAVELWRPQMEKAATVTVAQHSGASASAQFSNGQNVTSWPKGLPIAEGRDYVVSGGGLTRPASVRFAMLGSATTDPAETYAALDARGCNAQKQLLIGTLRRPE